MNSLSMNSNFGEERRNIAVTVELHGLLKQEAARRNILLYQMTEAVLQAWVNSGCPSLEGM